MGHGDVLLALPWAATSPSTSTTTPVKPASSPDADPATRHLRSPPPPSPLAPGAASVTRVGQAPIHRMVYERELTYGRTPVRESGGPGATDAHRDSRLTHEVSYHRHVLRLLGSGLLGFLVIAVWIYCVFDVIATDNTLVRNLPKLAWLLIVVFIPTVGAVAWLALGRPLYAGWRPGDTRVRAAPVVLGPEDSSRFPSRVDDQARDLEAWEDDLSRRERELRRRPDGKDDQPSG